MRGLEFLYFFGVYLYHFIYSCAYPFSSIWSDGMLVFTSIVIVMTLHFIIEKPRWQMVPSYLVVFTDFIFIVLYNSPFEYWNDEILYYITSLIFVTISFALSLVSFLE